MATTFFLRLIFIQVGFTAVTTTTTYSCLSNATCGCSLNSAVLTKIVGGEQAGTDTWGWIVSLRVNNNHICGGSLISSTIVLSAAHCLTSVKSISTLSVNVGSKYLSVIHQQRSVSKVYVHKNYNTSTFVNDIAIMQLSTAINLNDRSVALICLPSTATNNVEYPTVGTSVVAIGWGVLSSDSKTPPNTLQQVTLQTFSSTASNCRKSVNNATVQLCAGVQGGGKDTCQGDSGGPLMMFSNRQWNLIGITSYGTGCALPDYPGVYTRVSYYVDWISCFLTKNTSCIKNTVFKQYIFSSSGLRIFYKDITVFFLCLMILQLRLT
ncbi:unnamed protein product [Adineta steineri]|uniref:Peptidase S1 domain-containing protein n=1 Tax=Adineta steineri TaxID=433720 RepID=A0A813XSA3_9BILA|nr:unnamed protein product [Adineta steineri]CAF1256711.1 unnamed protein product [Adineta steineri]